MDFGSLLYGQSAEDDNRKRVMQEYWKLYTQAYNVKPIPVKTATGIEYRYPQGAVTRFQALLPFLQQQLAGSRTAAGGKQSKGLLGELTESAAGGLGKWGMNKLSDGKGWSGIFDKLWDSGKKGVGGLGDLFSGPGNATGAGSPQSFGDMDTSMSGGLPSTPMDLPSGVSPEDMPSFEAPSIFDSPEPTFADMVDYSTFTDAPLDVADYTDWAWF